MCILTERLDGPSAGDGGGDGGDGGAGAGGWRFAGQTECVPNCQVSSLLLQPLSQL